MRLRQATLLEKYPRIRSSNPEQVRAYLNESGFKFDINPQEVAELDACFNGVYLSKMRFGYYHYGPQISSRNAASNSDYWFVAPVRGSLEVVANRNSVTCTPGQAIVVPPYRAGLFRSQSGSARLHMCLSRLVLDQRLISLLGRPLREPLEFGPKLSLAEGHGRSLAGGLRLAIADLAGEGSILSSPITMQSFEEYVYLALLLQHPHNYSDLLQRTTPPIATRDVKRAIDYIQANLRSAISLSDIATISGVAGRTLLNHFSKFIGVSPMQYLRMARLDKARERLLGVQPEASVTEIATDCGFDHMGRFAAEYRRRFGESPSQTIGKRLRQYDQRHRDPERHKWRCPREL